MSPFDAGAAWRDKFVWALMGVGVAGIYDLGVKLKSSDKMTWRGFVGDICLQMVNAVVAVKIASTVGWDKVDTAYLAIGIGVIGQKTALHIFRSLALKWLGVPPEPTMPIPPSDAVSPRNASPAARRDLTARESPIANYGSKITPSPGLPGQDRDQDLLDRLPTTTNDEEPGQ